RGTAHIQPRAEIFERDEHSRRMHSGPPVVRAAQPPFEYGQLDIRMRGRANVVADLLQVVLDPANAGRIILRLIFVIMTAEDVEIAAGKINEPLAPVHVVGTLLPAGDDL